MGEDQMCQECKGTKHVPLGFYAGFPNGIGANPQLEPCRTCAGRNVAPIWAKAVMNAAVAALAAYRLAGN